MKYGSYRVYFHIGKIGFKFARLDFSVTNTFAVFLAGIIMNLLERKRYRYYVKRTPMKQWGRVWSYKGDDIALNPTYWTCGLFSIVRHLKPWNTTENWKVLYKNKWVYPKDVDNLSDIDLTTYDQMRRLFNSMVEFDSSSHGNVGIYDKDKLYAVDYGDFNIDRHNDQRVSYIDYA